MAQTTRRQALTLAGAATLMPIAGRTQACAEERVSSNPGAQTWAEERAKVMALGFTEAEADCWELINRAAAGFFELPELHPSDASEVAEAIHIVQNKLMGRPTYRRYIEPAATR